LQGGVENCSTCNLISGNRLAGVENADIVQGDFIGTNLAGTAAIPNGTDGGHSADGQLAAVVTSGAVGVSSPANFYDNCRNFCNLISGNDEPGVLLTGDTGGGVSGNTIGVGLTGHPLPNNGPGVEVQPGGTTLDYVGYRTDDPTTDTNPNDRGYGNTIFDNVGPAVLVVGATRDNAGPSVGGNKMGGNQAGIIYQPVDAAPVTPDAPDISRTDEGPLTISGTVAHFNSLKSSTFRIDIYATNSCRLDNVQGLAPIDVETVTFGSLTGDWTFTTNQPLWAYKFLTVTQTAETNEKGVLSPPVSELRTSPFSPCAVIPPEAH
jgi:hypothetical protein